MTFSTLFFFALFFLPFLFLYALILAPSLGSLLTHVLQYFFVKKKYGGLNNHHTLIYLLSNTPIVTDYMIEVPCKQHVHDEVTHERDQGVKTARHSIGNTQDDGARFSHCEVAPTELPSLDPLERLGVQMGRSNFNKGAKGHWKGEGGYTLEEETCYSNTEVISCFIIVEEHIVNILLREDSLEDDSHQDKSVGQLFNR